MPSKLWKIQQFSRTLKTDCHQNYEKYNHFQKPARPTAIKSVKNTAIVKNYKDRPLSKLPKIQPSSRIVTETDGTRNFDSILILILFQALDRYRDWYWYWYQENVPGLILIPRLYLIRILPKACKKCTILWIDTGTDTETQKKPRSRPILIPRGLVSIVSIRYRYSRLSLYHSWISIRLLWKSSEKKEVGCVSVLYIYSFFSF